jgi:hypothetical protein
MFGIEAVDFRLLRPESFVLGSDVVMPGGPLT